MPVTKFPNPRLAGPEGILAVGGDLHPDSLLLAYRQGIFPWPVYDPEVDESVLAWFSPDPRAILRFDEIHLPSSLRRARNQALRDPRVRWTINQAFESVIRNCSLAPRPGQAGTWITPEMLDAYLEFHRQGYAHSVEIWEEEELVGGIYGVEIDGVFAGESMFHKRPNASKLALLHLVEHLKKRGARWMDIQTMTPHMKALGAVEISRDEFLNELSRARALAGSPQRARRPFEDPCS